MAIFEKKLFVKCFILILTHAPLMMVSSPIPIRYSISILCSMAIPDSVAGWNHSYNKKEITQPIDNTLEVVSATQCENLSVRCYFLSIRRR